MPTNKRSSKVQKHVTAAADITAAVPITDGSSVASNTKQTDNFSMPMLEPSAANNHFVRAFAVLLATGIAAGSTQFLPARACSFVHLLAYSIFLGTNVWNTFFVGITMFKNMPRQMFGKVQSKLFPLYFALTSATNVLLLGTLALGSAAAPATSTLATLGGALAGSILNWLVIEPRCTSVMFQRYDLENTEPKTEAIQAQIKVLYKEFGKWHGISSVINLGVFCATIAHGWYLATRLVL